MTDKWNEPVQGTEEWLKQRAGKFTGSKFVDLLARAKKDGAPLKAWHDMIWHVVAERLTGYPIVQFAGFAGKWGHEVEDFSRQAYQIRTGAFVEQVGFIEHPKYPFAGASPDGLIDDDGGIEIKSPKSEIVQLERILNGMEPDHLPQVQGAMWVTGRKWWDFVSYHPAMPEHLRLYIQRVNRDEDYIAKIEASVLEAELAAQELMAKIAKKVPA